MFAQPMRYTCWHIRVRGSLLKRGFFSFQYENEAMLDLGLRLHHCEYSTLLGLGENFFSPENFPRHMYSYLCEIKF